MRKAKIAILVIVLVIAAFVAVKAIVEANRPLVEAPKGTAPIDNKVDTSGFSHLVVDEAGVLSAETKQSALIYNANWAALDNRVLAVVTVQSTEDAEADAWQWFARLSMGENDALLLVEAGGNKDCVLVAKGKYEKDLATLHYGYMDRMTYMPLRDGDFDAAVLEVYGQMHYFYGYDEEAYWRSEVRGGIIALIIFAAVNIPILIHLIGEKIDGRRFKRWYEDFGITDPTLVPWKTLFFWHRVGSRWYESRINGAWVDYDAAVRTGRRSVNMVMGRRIGYRNRPNRKRDW